MNKTKDYTAPIPFGNIDHLLLRQVYDLPGIIMLAEDNHSPEVLVYRVNCDNYAVRLIESATNEAYVIERPIPSYEDDFDHEMEVVQCFLERCANLNLPARSERNLRSAWQVFRRHQMAEPQI